MQRESSWRQVALYSLPGGAGRSPTALAGIKVSDPSNSEALNSPSFCLGIMSAATWSQTYSSKQDKGMQRSLHICICWHRTNSSSSWRGSRQGCCPLGMAAVTSTNEQWIAIGSWDDKHTLAIVSWNSKTTLWHSAGWERGRQLFFLCQSSCPNRRALVSTCLNDHTQKAPETSSRSHWVLTTCE